MWKEYAPEPRMRLNLGIRRRLAPLLNNDRRIIGLANSLLFSLPGSPTIYYGDEIGMGDNIELFDRNGVRTPMQWDNGRNAGFSKIESQELYSPVIQTPPFDSLAVNVATQMADAGSLFNLLRRMISVRKMYTAFGWGNLTWADTGSNAVAAYWRTFADQTLLFLNNLSGSARLVVLNMPNGYKGTPLDLLTGSYPVVVENGKLHLTLAPYQFIWFKL